MKHLTNSTRFSCRAIAMLVVLATMLGVLVTAAIPAIGALEQTADDSAVTVDPDLYLSMDFDPDDSGNVYTGGSVTLPVTGLYGAALAVSGGGQSGSALTAGTASIVTGVDYQFSEGHTISLWVNGKAGEGTSVLFAKGDKVSGHFEVYTTSGPLYLYSPDLGNIDLGFNMNTLSGGWHNLIFARKNGQLVTYADGKLVSAVACTGTIAETTADFAVGALTENSLIFAGSIDTVRLYNRLLTDEEIAAGNVGNNAPSIEIEGNIAGQVSNTDFDFNEGTTINFWFNADAFPDGFYVMLAKAYKSSARHFELYTENGGLRLYGPVFNGGVPINWGVDMRDYVGAWHMLTIVWRNSKLDLYIDAEFKASADVYAAAESGPDDYVFGRLLDGGMDFQGRIAEGELLSEILSDAAITARYEAKLGEVKPEDPSIEIEGNIAGQVAHTDFDFNEGTTINFWFNADAFPNGFYVMLAKAYKHLGRHFELYTENGGLRLYGPVFNGGVPINWGVDMRDYVGAWHMLTVVWRNGKLDLYIDAEFKASADVYAAAESGPDDYVFGRLLDGGMDFQGRIAEGELLSEILSDEAITARYEAKLPETDAPETDAPETDAPETDAPETDAPETDAPETDAPETDAPETDAPETDAPETDAPETDAPETDAPETDAPETDAPETGNGDLFDDGDDDLFSGCFSVIGSGALVVALCAGGVLLLKKKED